MLFVRLGVHEHEAGIVPVQVLHLLALDDGEADVDAGVERPVDHGARLHVPQLGADERASLARLDVLELDHLEQRAVELQRHPALEVVRAHAHARSTPATGR